jgi:hypothetical protein
LGEIQYRKPSRNADEDGEFRENRCSESHALVLGVKEHFRFVFIKFGIADFHRNLLSGSEFRENCCSESHALLEGIREFLSALSTFLPDFD